MGVQYKVGSANGGQSSGKARSKMKRLLRVLSLLVFAASCFVYMIPFAFGAGGPTVTAIAPSSAAIGASVTISGSGFGSTQGTSSVKFNGTVATNIKSWGSSSIAVIVPSGTTTGSVTVTVSGKTSNGVTFTVVPAPAILSLSPTSGAIGSIVTITGTNFGIGQGSVIFNGCQCNASISNWSDTSVAAYVPFGATTGNLYVSAAGVSSNGAFFTVWPNISTITPSVAPVGGTFTVSGSNFGNTQGNGTVTIGGADANITSWTSTSISATVPQGASSGAVVVTANGLASNAAFLEAVMNFMREF
jgi:hypothetical protein